MKRIIILSLLTVLPVIVLSAILINNRETMNEKLIDDKILSYPVRVAQVITCKYSDSLNIVGTTQAYSDIEIISETDGVVISTGASEGERIGRNTIILKVESDLARADYELAHASFTKASRDVERFTSLSEKGNISLNEFETAKLNLADINSKYTAAKKQLSDKEIRSPINGILTKRYVDAGGTVLSGMPIANVVDISRLKVNVNVSLKDLLQIQVNSKVRIISEFFPENEFTGTVKSVGIKADEASTYPVQIIIDNKEHILKAGMLVNVIFNFTSETMVKLIPRIAVVGNNTNPKVFKIENGVAILTDIVAGEILDDNIVVKTGLQTNDQIVINGQNNLEDNAKVEIRN